MQTAYLAGTGKGTGASPASIRFPWLPPLQPVFSFLLSSLLPPSHPPHHLPSFQQNLLSIYYICTKLFLHRGLVILLKRNPSDSVILTLAWLPAQSLCKTLPVPCPSRAGQACWLLCCSVLLPTPSVDSMPEGIRGRALKFLGKSSPKQTYLLSHNYLPNANLTFFSQALYFLAT